MATLHFTDKDDDCTVDATLGDTICFDLPENGTTPYAWTVISVTPPILELTNSSFNLPNEARIGGGGRREFLFAVVQPGYAHLELHLRPRWEANEPPAARFRLTVHVH